MIVSVIFLMNRRATEGFGTRYGDGVCASALNNREPIIATVSETPIKNKYTCIATNKKTSKFPTPRCGLIKGKQSKASGWMKCPVGTGELIQGIDSNNQCYTCTI